MKTFLPAAFLLCPLLSYACSFAPGYEKLKPAVAAFEARMAGEAVALLPPPRVATIRVYRGTASPGSSCDDAGSLVLELDWPKSAGYRLQELRKDLRMTKMCAVPIATNEHLHGSEVV